MLHLFHHFKKQFESRLSPDTLKSFQEAGNHWTNNPTYEKLFLFWKSLTSPGSLESQESTALEIGEKFTNNIDEENVLDATFNFEDLMVY